MVNTRNHNNNTENNDAENNNAANPPPTLEQVLMMQLQMLQTKQQTMVNMQNAQFHASTPPPRDRLRDFQWTIIHVIERVTGHTLGNDKEHNPLRIKNDLKAPVEDKRAAAPWGSSLWQNHLRKRG
jgi:hypothetical protein